MRGSLSFRKMDFASTSVSYGYLQNLYLLQSRNFIEFWLFCISEIEERKNIMTNKISETATSTASITKHAFYSEEQFQKFCRDFKKVNGKSVKVTYENKDQIKKILDRLIHLNVAAPKRLDQSLSVLYNISLAIVDVRTASENQVHKYIGAGKASAHYSEHSVVENKVNRVDELEELWKQCFEQHVQPIMDMVVFLRSVGNELAKANIKGGKAMTRLWNETVNFNMELVENFSYSSYSLSKYDSDFQYVCRTKKEIEKDRDLYHEKAKPGKYRMLDVIVAALAKNEVTLNFPYFTDEQLSEFSNILQNSRPEDRTVYRYRIILKRCEMYCYSFEKPFCLSDISSILEETATKIDDRKKEYLEKNKSDSMNYLLYDAKGTCTIEQAQEMLDNFRRTQRKIHRVENKIRNSLMSKEEKEAYDKASKCFFQIANSWQINEETRNLLNRYKQCTHSLKGSRGIPEDLEKLVQLYFKDMDKAHKILTMKAQKQGNLTDDLWADKVKLAKMDDFSRVGRFRFTCKSGEEQ